MCPPTPAVFQLPSLPIEYLVELREYGPVYSTWSALEGELAEPLEGVSACIGNCSTALEELTDDITEELLPVLREYILYSDSMKVSTLSRCLRIVPCVCADLPLYLRRLILRSYN